MTMDRFGPRHASRATLISEIRRLESELESSRSPGCSMRAEVRNVRDATDEYERYLVFVVDGESHPYMQIPETMPDDILEAALKKLNAQ